MGLKHLVLQGYENYLRQLHGKELNLVKDGGIGGLSACLVYPNRYYVAMSSLGYLSVYRTAVETFGVSVERATFPDDGHLTYLEKAGKSILTI